MKHISELRKEKELTQSQLAGLLNISQQAVSKYEKEERDPDIDVLIRISRFFNVSTDYLLGITENKLPYGTTSYSDTKLYSNDSIGNSLNYWISKSYYSDDELTEKLGISKELLNDYCSGLVEPSLDILQSLSKICEVSTDCLLGLREHSRPKHEGKYPFQFDPKISQRLKEEAKSMSTSYSGLADTLGITEDEVFNFFEYGFIPHISVLSRLAKYYNVTADYLLNLSDSKLGINSSIEPVYTALTELNSVNRVITHGEILKLLKEQEKENYMEKQSVAADHIPVLMTGTDNLGK